MRLKLHHDIYILIDNVIPPLAATSPYYGNRDSQRAAYISSYLRLFQTLLATSPQSKASMPPFPLSAVCSAADRRPCCMPFHPDAWFRPHVRKVQCLLAPGTAANMPTPTSTGGNLKHTADGKNGLLTIDQGLAGLVSEQNTRRWFSPELPPDAPFSSSPAVAHSTA
jgi:hypothetical protein